MLKQESPRQACIRGIKAVWMEWYLAQGKMYFLTRVLYPQDKLSEPVHLAIIPESRVE